MKHLFILLILTLSLFSEAWGNDYAQMIDMMVESRVISEKEGIKAKVKLPSDPEALGPQRLPASLEEEKVIKQYLGRDLTKSQLKQIENELESLMEDDQ